jgi:hypothetical protein
VKEKRGGGIERERERRSARQMVCVRERERGSLQCEGMILLMADTPSVGVRESWCDRDITETACEPYYLYNRTRQGYNINLTWFLIPG